MELISQSIIHVRVNNIHVSHFFMNTPETKTEQRLYSVKHTKKMDEISDLNRTIFSQFSVNVALARVERIVLERDHPQCYTARR